ncbi:hydroxyacylglutathione hydrolase [Nematocida ausubeli]|uniref:hydroxyacylglutathione hydrolase n=1 Tax=Nematocida ausubeli (strain ATCC PRA-371 / ERTm2) TaxID=1913371 RepID=H8ZGH7_NEMA1|nr:hydroxyacylglutathione hydrolase [Nematocida ausubeli]
MLIVPIGARETNLMYVVVGPQSELIFVDPVDPMKIEEAAKRHSALEAAVVSLTTHHHEDHSSGNKEIKRRFPQAEIYAGSEKAYCTKTCKDGDIIQVGSLQIECMHVPCHTQDSFAYVVHDVTKREQKAVFVGDTLFYLGCGLFTEGTGEMMYAALSRIAALPPATAVYYGHEYRESNLQFRRTLVPDPACISLERIFLTVEEEKKHNFYINTELVSEIEGFKGKTPVERVCLLRKMKNEFNAQKKKETK